MRPVHIVAQDWHSELSLGRVLGTDEEAETKGNNRDRPRRDAVTGQRHMRFTIDVPLDLHSRIKVACAARGVKMADVLRTQAMMVATSQMPPIQTMLCHIVVFTILRFYDFTREFPPTAPREAAATHHARPPSGNRRAAATYSGPPPGLGSGHAAHAGS